MLINCIALILNIIVSLQEILVIESKIFLLFSCHNQLVLDISQLGFTIEYLGVQISVSSILILSLSLQIRFVAELPVEVSLKGLSLSHKS